MYYGSEWGAKGNKSDGDQALRACFAEPVENELSEFIGRLAEAKKGSRALNFGDFRSVVLTNKQCIFERAVEGERAVSYTHLDVYKRQYQRSAYSGYIYRWYGRCGILPCPLDIG